MINLNLQNIEEFIFFDKNIYSILPDFNQLFMQWKLAMQVTDLHYLRKKSINDLFNNITPEHINILENYFNDKVSIDRIDHHIVKNYNVPLSEDLNCLDILNNISIFRDEELIYICSWR